MNSHFKVLNLYISFGAIRFHGTLYDGRWTAIINCCRQNVLNEFIFNPVIFGFFLYFHWRIRAFLIKDSPLPRYSFHGTVLNQKCSSISKSDANNNNSSSNEFVFFVDVKVCSVKLFRHKRNNIIN